MKNLMKIPVLIFVCIVSGAGLLFCIVAFILLSSPDVSQLKGCMTTSMYKVKVCPGTSSYVSYRSLPESLIDALVVSEDAAFFSHSGFDWYELRESFEKNLSNYSYKRGGSTLTQQLAKNAFLSPEKSIWRKLNEAYLTHQLESQFSKKEILEKYFNMVEFGKDLYGIKNAAQRYFGKSPHDLHLLESVFLVMLLPNPKKYSQSFRNGRLTPFAQNMIKIILKRLVQYRKISPAAYSFAIDNLGSFPWSGLSQSDFQFSLPKLPEGNAGFDTPQEPMDEEELKNEITQEAGDAIESNPEEEIAPTEETEIPPSEIPEDEDPY